MKALQTLIFTLLVGATPALAQPGSTTQSKAYELSCQKNTRTYVSHTSLSFNDVDLLKYSFYYSYDIYKLGPKETAGLIAPGGDDRYPTVSRVSVTNEGDNFEVKAVSQVVGGRNPHLQTLELKMTRYSVNTYFPSLLLINGQNYTWAVGTCELKEISGEAS